MAQWTVNAREVGVRLDKFLAGADRIGSRVRAAAALERGKIFLNEREMTLDHAGTRPLLALPLAVFSAACSTR